MTRIRISLTSVASLLFVLVATHAAAADLIVELKNGDNVTFVGAINRWDTDGNHRTPVDPKAKIDQPGVTAKARSDGNGRWVFDNLSSGRYDLVILADGQIRIEGFHYPPVLEFAPFMLYDKTPPQSAVEWITRDIARSRHYENKVSPLYFGGDEKQVRVFVQLLRDEPTSFDAEFGEQVATLRHEVWQYSNRYGGWAKEKRTKVFDRVLMAKRELRRWTWIWEPKLGGVELGDQPVTLSYELPRTIDAKTSRGLLPY